jgi:nucleotide sugar dehydrogenase
MKVAVVGAGKMGLPLACQIASSGASVTACDKSSPVVEAINAGRMPFDEPGVGELLAELHRAGGIRAVTDVAEGVRGCDVAIVIIPVLLTPEKSADLSIMDEVTEQIAAVLAPGMLVSYETTLPVGTTRNHLRPILESSGLTAGTDFDLVFSPERVKSRLVMKHLSSVPKIVGGVSAWSARRGEEFYAKYLRAPVINVETLEAAEFAKLAGMIYRDVNIALANQLAGYAERAGLNFADVVRAANTDGESYLLTPGIGVGGHCTPVYPYFVLRDAERRDVPMTLAAGAREINDGQAAHALDRLEEAGLRLAGARILILGLGFRPEVKEHTLSPAFLIRDEAAKRQASVVLHDPLYSREEIARHGFVYQDLAEASLPEVVVLNTAHRAYADPDFAGWHARGVRYVVDGRNFWDANRVAGAGLAYFAPGAPTLSGQLPARRS